MTEYIACAEVTIPVGNVEYEYTILLRCKEGDFSFGAHDAMGRETTVRDHGPDIETAEIDEVTCFKYWGENGRHMSEECSGPHSHEDLMDKINWDKLRWSEI